MEVFQIECRSRYATEWRVEATLYTSEEARRVAIEIFNKNNWAVQMRIVRRSVLDEWQLDDIREQAKVDTDEFFRKLGWGGGR